MEDFASILVAARERARMTQSEVATAAGLTPSYLSFIENRKKPPPSDDVCTRLARVLGLPARKLIEVAHLERAPSTVRKRVDALRHTLKRERRTRKRLLESLLSPFLFAGPPGYLESAIDAVGITPTRRRRLREVLGAVGRRHQDRADEVSRIVDDLPEKDRKLLLAALPELLRPNKSKPSEPTVWRSLPEPSEVPEKPFLLAAEATKAMEGGSGEDTVELRPGDHLLLDPALAPEQGDLFVLRGEDGSGLLRRCEEEKLGPPVGAVVGCVVEIRRPLRRRGPPR